MSENEFINRIKADFNGLKSDFSALGHAVKNTNQAKKRVQAEIPVAKEAATELQANIETMKIKNQPRIDRMQETLDHLKETLKK